MSSSIGGNFGIRHEKTAQEIKNEFLRPHTSSDVIIGDLRGGGLGEVGGIGGGSGYNAGLTYYKTEVDQYGNTTKTPLKFNEIPVFDTSASGYAQRQKEGDDYRKPPPNPFDNFWDWLKAQKPEFWIFTGAFILFIFNPRRT
jgi:hypothetical protein